MSLYVQHRFGLNETLSGVLKKYNSHAASAEQIRLLLERYNALNGRQVPKVGDTRLIPVDFLPEKQPSLDGE